MTALGAIVMTVRFVCELAALAVTAWWGHRTFGVAAFGTAIASLRARGE